MRQVERSEYVKKLANKQNNGLIKVITGIRRAGKSYLLDPLFTGYLRASGVDDRHIIKIDLDRGMNDHLLSLNT